MLGLYDYIESYEKKRNFFEDLVVAVKLTKYLLRKEERKICLYFLNFIKFYLIIYNFYTNIILILLHFIICPTAGFDDSRGKMG
jgi:hypothetical protein